MIPIVRPLPSSEEQEAVLRVLASGQLAQGEYVSAFEQRFADVCNVREAVAVSLGTAALHLTSRTYETPILMDLETDICFLIPVSGRFHFAPAEGVHF